jgi:D-tyrosyl-tRNA(Tyr) deacylase
VRALLQRVHQASVTVEGETIGAIGPGLLILICAMQGDTTAQADQLAAKIAKLRIFKDDAGKMNLSLKDAGGSALIVSQFTLAADTSRGNRPGFSPAAPPRGRPPPLRTFHNRPRSPRYPHGKRGFWRGYGCQPYQRRPGHNLARYGKLRRFTANDGNASICKDKAAFAPHKAKQISSRDEFSPRKEGTECPSLQAVTPTPRAA